jgi:lactate dehydrogenase-like 2-hydroxyacid dehydrogenase
MPSRPIVTITRKLPAEVEEAAAGRFDLRLNERDVALTPAELKAALGRSDALICTVSDRLDAAALGAEPLRTRILANYGVGYNHIDVAAAQARGVVITNTPGVLTDATAELAVALLLMVTRRTGEGEREVRAGRWTGWRPTHLLGTALTGKTLGIVGMGRIGQATALRLQLGWGMQVIHYSRSEVTTIHDPRLTTRRVELDDLMRAADVVSLHVPGSPETRRLIDARRLGLMQPTAYLINTARGDVVDQPALVGALRAGRIAGAGLDVYDGEPAVPAELLALDNVVLLPHLGSATRETRVAMGMRALENLELFFAGKPVRDPVA